MKKYEKYCVYDNVVAFWGSEFGNFHRCTLTYKSFVWGSSEQAYMAEKAIYFNDYGSLYEIMLADTPREAKAIGRRVRNFNAEEWNKVSFDIMYDIVYQKFAQNKNLKEMLMDPELEGKHFVEGSPEDGIWGVKVAWDDPRIDDMSNWHGENRLGKVLDKVRETFKQEYLL